MVLLCDRVADLRGVVPRGRRESFRRPAPGELA